MSRRSGPPTLDVSQNEIVNTCPHTLGSSCTCASTLPSLPSNFKVTHDPHKSYIYILLRPMPNSRKSIASCVPTGPTHAGIGTSMTVRFIEGNRLEFMLGPEWIPELRGQKWVEVEGVVGVRLRFERRKGEEGKSKGGGKVKEDSDEEGKGKKGKEEGADARKVVYSGRATMRTIRRSTRSVADR